jgi:hypothetical protein
MENKYLFKSKYKISRIIIPTLASMWFWESMYFDLQYFSIWIFSLSEILFFYLLLAIYQSRYYFYDDQIIRIFTFRPFFRKAAFKYEQIFKIKYIHIPYFGTRKFIVFRNKRQYFQTFNSFSFNKQDERIQIVDFLLSKNVKIEVRSDFEKKDKEIIDMVKKKYPNNIH